MIPFDAHQEHALRLDPRLHARILGAPGTGKTTVLVERVRRLIEEESWSHDQLLVLAANRGVATMLRTRIEAALSGVTSGTLVRTAASLAFALVARSRAVSGEHPPELLTGASQEAALQRAARRLDAADFAAAGLPPEVADSPMFRAELREFWRLLDDYGGSSERLRELLAQTEAATSGRPFLEAAAPFQERWLLAAELVAEARILSATLHPEARSVSAVFREALETIDAAPVDARISSPRLVLIDDAAELGEGALGLLAALARRGTAVWAFGDPDIATQSFQGQGTSLLAGITPEFARAGTPALPQQVEQYALLGQVHRHGPRIRQLVAGVTAKIGTAGVGQQRRASVAPEREGTREIVQFTRTASVAEQIGVIAHRLRSRHLGVRTVGDETGAPPPTAWSRMAVVCRSSSEAQRTAALLAHQQVPTVLPSGGITLGAHAIVRDLVTMMRDAVGAVPLAPDSVPLLLTGPLGGLDPLAIRRLFADIERQIWHEASDTTAGATRDTAQQRAHAVLTGQAEIADSAEARVLRRLARARSAGAQAHAAGATPREVLWAVWEKSGVGTHLRQRALRDHGRAAEHAHRALDAVLALFYALQRHEESASETRIDDLLTELMTSEIAQDTLAARSLRDAVIVTTPQGTIGAEFDVVCILGPQEGMWPNLKTRGTILGTVACERVFRGEEPLPATRQETLHDELRLFAHALARATHEILVVAVSNEDAVPSTFSVFGQGYEVEDLPSSRLTLRGMTAQLRRRLHRDPDDDEAASSLAVLARSHVPGADPDEWYGVRSASTTRPLTDFEADQHARVHVSPSKIQTVEDCPVNWVIAHLGGARADTAASIGTLIHHALDVAASGDPERMLRILDEQWSTLAFESDWQETQQRRTADAMIRGLADYLRAREATGAGLLAAEAAFEVEIGPALLRGQADRIERRVQADGSESTLIVDVKTGAHPPSRAELAEHAQLLAYQLGATLGAFAVGEPAEGVEAASAGASLVYVHPRAQRSGETYRVLEQEPLTDETRHAFEERVQRVAQIMAGSVFTARVQHHCESHHQQQPCAVHIIPAVSHA